MKLSEQLLLECIDAYFSNTSAHAPLGRGHDCATLICPAQMVLSTDVFCQDVHFRTQYFSPYDIGYKALAVNISDIAAAGAQPLGFSLALGLPAFVDVAYFQEMMQGMAGLATEYNITLTGGDLTFSPYLFLSCTIWGQAYNQKNSIVHANSAENSVPQFFKRQVAQAGDAIFCIGALGQARTGLYALEAMGQAAKQQYPVCTHSHLQPMPQIGASVQLAQWATANNCWNQIGLMDVSDGIAQDLPRLLPQGMGATMELSASQLHPECVLYAQEQHPDAVTDAIIGGEDFALLGTCPVSLFNSLCASVPQVWQLGNANSSGFFSLNGKAFFAKGFDHFAV